MFVSLLLAASAAPVLADPAPEGSASLEDDPERYFDGHVVPVDLGAVEREEREREEWLASPEAVQQRQASWSAHGDASPLESEELLRTVFAEQLATLNGDPARFLSDAQLVMPLDETAAAVSDEGDRSLLDATIPLRVENEQGDLAKVDLSLTQTPQGYEPVNAFSDLLLPLTGDEKTEVGDRGFAISQAGAEASPAGRFGDKNLFYPEVLPDTDLMVSPTGTGVELFNLLRSKDSPEEFRFEIDLPAGAGLHAAEYGGAVVIRDGETLNRIAPPSAVDAQGTDVPVEMSVEQSAIVLRVNHRQGDFAAPILLDPIVEDWANTGNNWYEGKKLDALTNGAWKYKSNNSQIGHDVCCYEGNRHGLLTWTNKNVFYGSNQFGQWSYSTPNYAAFVTWAWITPFWRHVESCGSSVQPHDYAGILWEPGEIWNPVKTNQAQHGTVSMSGKGHAFIIGLGSGPPGVWISCARYIYAGGVALWLDDDWGTAVSVTGLPTGWIGDQKTSSISVKANDNGTGADDDGLGINRVKILSEGKGEVAVDTVGNCTGLYGAVCPTVRNSQFNVTGDSFGEGIRKASVTASDPTGKTSEAPFTVKVDNSPPEVALSGQLAKATGEEVTFSEGEKPVSAGKDQLSLPVYKLEIKAKDGVWGTTNDKDKRSGVKDIEVWLDGKELAVPWNAKSECPQTSCEMAQIYPLDLTEIDTAGSHKLKVIAKDFVGEEKKREIEFEYFPATGIKDEYLMHYFPLPNGQGNEDEEEHPVRPELAVNVMNGNLVYRERDIDVEGTAQVDLEVERYYNSMRPDSENTEWGDGWTLAQTPDLDPIDTGGSPAPDVAELIDRSGALEEAVELPTEVGAEKFDPALQATLTKKEGGGFELTDETGESATSVVFDSTGQTEARVTDGYAKVDYAYEGGELSEIEVEDPSTFAADPEELEIPAPTLVGTPVYASAFGSNGSGNGQLKAPSDVAVDTQGNLWVIDKSNNRVQKFSSSGSYLSQFGSAGSTDGKFNRPTSIAIASNGDLLITDSGNARIQRFSSSGTYLSKFGSSGTGNGQFAGSGPEGITIDASGNIWVSDTYGGRLQKFNSSGTFVKVVGSKGSGSGQLGEPTGLDVDAGGNVWVADWQNNRVSVFTNDGTFLSQFGSAGSGNGQFSHPDEIEIDKFGNVWVGDQSNNRIQRFNMSAQYVGKFGSSGSGPGQFSFTYPMGITTDSKGHLWVADPNNSRVQQWLAPIDKPTYASSFGANGSGNGQFKAPADVAVDSFGNLWVADKSNNRIQKFDAAGNFIAKYGSLGSGNGQFNRPSSIAVDRDGNILVADSNNHRIQKFNPAGEFISKFGSLGSGNGQLNKPEEVIADFKGNIWVADILNGRVQKFDEEGTFLKVVDSGQLYEPMGIDVDPSGNIWVADWQKNRLSVFDSEGNFKSNVGSAGSGNGQFNRPDAVEIDNKGSVWVADLLNNRVQRFDLAGQYQGQFGSAGTGAGQFSLDWPSGITTDREGRLWVTDVLNSRIQKWLTANYAPAQAAQLDLTDGDASVEVETPGGLVASVSGNAAGEHDYAHEGDLLISHDGPDGETEYDYDTEGRLTKVTLPNGTWAEIIYEATYGRVTQVKVSVEGGAAKATTFEYKDEPRSTKVIPSDAPHVVYDIGDDGSVLKWWNTQKPPELDLEGALYDNREKEGFIWEGARVLDARAESAEGIASIEVIADGDTLVDEQTCPKPQVIECLVEKSEWVTEADLHAPGHLQLEVIATDRLGESTSERFWVNVPEPPPIALGTPVPPRFRDIAKFREEWGLEVVFPVESEIELNERILDLIKAWNEPNTPAGQVARSSMEQWGVPLRPADVAELEYRESYIEQNAPAIESWANDHAEVYGGYYVDHAQGGKIKVGLTAGSSAMLGDLENQPGIVAADRFVDFAVSKTYSNLVEVEKTISSVWLTDAILSPSMTELSIDDASNKVLVGATDVTGVQNTLVSILGPGAPINVTFQEPPEPVAGRYRTAGRIRAGDALNKKDFLPSCTAGFGARQPKPKQNGQTAGKTFLLTAGHCFVKGQLVARAPKPEPFQGEDREIGTVTRRALTLSDTYETDAEAIELGSASLAPLQIYRPSDSIGIESASRVVKDQVVCFSGKTSEKIQCGKVQRLAQGRLPAPFRHGLHVWIVISKPSKKGDSGSPVWIRGNHRSVGMMSGTSSKSAYITPLINPGEIHNRQYSEAEAPGALKSLGSISLIHR